MRNTLKRFADSRVVVLIDRDSFGLSKLSRYMLGETGVPKVKVSDVLGTLLATSIQYPESL